jgi:hypothetical protein
MILGQVEASNAVEPIATPDSGTVSDPTPMPEATTTKGRLDSGYCWGLWGYWSLCIQGRNKMEYFEGWNAPHSHFSSGPNC